jgi:hypothetical protein
VGELIGFTQDTETGNHYSEGADRSAFDEAISEQHLAPGPSKFTHSGEEQLCA